VLVKGSSIVNWVSPMGGPRTDFSFPRVIEQRLLDHGQSVELRANTVPRDVTRVALRTWPEEVFGFSPDAIVLAFGYYECVHLFVPRWLEKHKHSLIARPRGYATLYRRWLVRPVYRLAARAQARIDRRVGSRWGVRRRRRVLADLNALVTRVLEVGSPLVIVMELLPVTERYQSWFPGMNHRVEQMNQGLEELVARFDRDNVRYFRTSTAMESVGATDTEALRPDGFHFTPELHRAIGEHLGDEILGWARHQPHLSGRV
jgi:hypothetical protein